MRAAAWSLIAALALGAVFGLHVINDPDLHQQVAVGRAILADPSSIGTSKFTYTFPGYRYVEDKWLSSVVVALVVRRYWTSLIHRNSWATQAGRFQTPAVPAGMPLRNDGCGAAGRDG